MWCCLTAKVDNNVAALDSDVTPRQRATPGQFPWLPVPVKLHSADTLRSAMRPFLLWDVTSPDLGCFNSLPHSAHSWCEWEKVGTT